MLPPGQSVKPQPRSTKSTAGRRPGARCGRQVGVALGGLRFEDGTLLHAARWLASPAGPYTEVLRQDASGRRLLVTGDDRGRALGRWLHAFDECLLSQVDWTSSSQQTTLSWTEQSQAHQLQLSHPSHLGFELASAVLARLSERVLLSPRVLRLAARLLGPALGIGSFAVPARTSAGVPVHFLLRRLQPVLRATYTKDHHLAGNIAAGRQGGSALLPGLPLRPLILEGELLFVPAELPVPSTP